MTTAAPSPVYVQHSIPFRVWRFIREGRTAITIYCTVIVLMLLCFYFMPLPHDPLQPDATKSLNGPTSDHWFGTDTIGRDIFARTVRAGKTDLPLALGGTALALVVGVAIGLIVSSKSPWSERIMRGLDVFQAFPIIILAIAIVSLSGNNITMVMFAIALIFAPLFIRLVRSEALALRESRFIEAAIAIGGTPKRVALKHMLPNVTGIILVQTALTASRSLLVISGLSFLGIGVSPPTPSWGAMIQVGSQNIASGQWWVSVFPGFSVVICVLIFNQLGDALEKLLGRGARG